MDDDQQATLRFHRDEHGNLPLKRPRGSDDDGGGSNSREGCHRLPSKNASSVRVANPRSGGCSALKPELNQYEKVSEWFVSRFGLDKDDRRFVVDIDGVARELGVTTSCVNLSLMFIARTGAVMWVGDSYRWTGMRKFNTLLTELLVDAKAMFPAHGRAKPRTTKLVKEVLRDGRQKLSKFGMFEAIIQLIAASDEGVDLDHSARRLLDLVVSEKQPGRSSLTNVKHVLCHAAYCMVGFGIMTRISYERAGVKNNWLQWVGRPEEQEQQQEQERRNQPHGRSEKGSANPGEAGLDADDRFGIDARSIEMDRIRNLEPFYPCDPSSRRHTEPAIARVPSRMPGQPETPREPPVDEVVDDDWSRLPKVLPFMDVTEKEGEKGAPIWDPRMGPGRRWYRKEAGTTAPPVEVSSVSTHPASSDKYPCKGAAGSSAPTVRFALGPLPGPNQALVRPSRDRAPSKSGRDATADADARTRASAGACTSAAADADATAYAHVRGSAHGRANAHVDIGAGNAGPVKTPSVATRAPSSIASHLSRGNSASSHKLHHLQGESSSRASFSEPPCPGNSRVCTPARPRSPVPDHSGGARGTTAGVHNAEKAFGGGISAGPGDSGANASKQRGMPAVRDDMDISDAEDSDTAGTSHPASLFGVSYLPSSFSVSSQSEQSSGSPYRSSSSSPCRKYRRSDAPAGSSRLSRSDRRSESPARSFFKATLSSATSIATAARVSVGRGCADGGGGGSGGDGDGDGAKKPPRSPRGRKATSADRSRGSGRNMSTPPPRSKSSCPPRPRFSGA